MSFLQVCPLASNRPLRRFFSSQWIKKYDSEVGRIFPKLLPKKRISVKNLVPGEFNTWGRVLRWFIERINELLINYSSIFEAKLGARLIEKISKVCSFSHKQNKGACNKGQHFRFFRRTDSKMWFGIIYSGNLIVYLFSSPLKNNLLVT